MRNRIIKPSLLFSVGGLVYGMMEILWRGTTHWSMLIVGGLAFLLIGAINEVLSWDTPLVLQCAIATGLVLTVEFVAGCIVNLWLGWGVWDYSHLPLNLLGQICASYGVLWYLISAFGIWLDDWLRWKIYKEEKPRYKIF